MKLIGQIDRDGSAVFPGHRFRQSQADELAEWIEELKTYGAQGAPTGKPLWGLQRAQFTEIFDSLKATIEGETKGRPVEEVIAAMPLPANYPVRWHTSTDTIRETASSIMVQQEVRGLSTGTGLAIILADLGLGYRPLRTPTGSIELVIQRLSDAPDAWPVGWDPLEGTSRLQLAPTMFQMERVGFDEVPLIEILNAIETATRRPDHRRLRTLPGTRYRPARGSGQLSVETDRMGTAGEQCRSAGPADQGVQGRRSGPHVPVHLSVRPQASCAVAQRVSATTGSVREPVRH